MRLLGITDLHGQQEMLEQILRHAGAADVILLGGDLTNFGTSLIAVKMVEIAQATGAQVFAVAGNCDSPEIDSTLRRLGVSLFHQGVVYEEVGFLGVSAMPPWHGTMYELSEEEIAQSLQDGYRQVEQTSLQVVLAHPPPYDTPLDLTARGEHVGSRALRQFIEEHQPTLVVCGHIHEARGTARLGQTVVVNCGSAMDGRYAQIDLEPDGQVQVQLRRV